MPNTLFRHIIAPAAAVFLVGAPAALLVAQEPDAPAFAHEASDLEPDSRVIYGTLSNGLRYAVMKNETPSDVAAVRMQINTGSVNETEAQLGLAHFLEHMAFNGSVNVPEGEMIKRLERYGLSFGADTNASTGFDQTTYKLNLPSVEDEVLDEAFFLMRETAENLLLDAGAIERERGVIASEKLARDSLQFRAFVDRLGFLTRGSGLIDRLPIGTDETIATMPRAEFVSYYRGYYRPENTFIAVIGDLEPEDAIARIEEYFGDWQPAGAALPQRPRNQASIVPGTVYAYHDEGLMTSVSIAALRPYTKRPDTAATRRDNAIISLGTRILNQRMSRAVQNGTAAYLAGLSSRSSVDDVVDGMLLNVRTTPDDWRAALSEAEQELRRAVQFGFSQEELDEQIANYRRSLGTAVERANTRKTYAGFEYNYAQALVSAFADERVFTSPQSSLDRFNAIAEGLTVEEINAAFRDAWRGYENPAVYFVSGEPLEDAETVLAQALKQSQQVAVVAPEARDVGSFAYTDFGPAGEVVSDIFVEDADAHLIKFGNNVRLNFKQTDFDTGTINIRVRVGGGFMSMPRKDEGLRRLGLNVLSRSGVVGHTANDLRTLFAGQRVGALTRTMIDNDAFEILGTTGADDLSDQLNLMAAKVAAPAFREVIAERHFRNMEAWYPTHDSSPGAVANKYLPRLIRSGDTRYGYDGIDSFLSATLDEVREWVEPEFKTGLIEITVVGDVDKEAVVREIARTFGALPMRADQKADFGANADLAFPSGSETPNRFYHRGNEEQALVYVYWPAPDASDPANAYRMRVLRGVFRNRLTDVLREEMGATYSPGAGAFSNSIFDGYGYALARVTAKPEDVGKVQGGILRVATELAETGIDSDAFDRALTPLIEDLNSIFENNGYWLNVLGDAQTGSDGLATFRAHEKTYREATVEEINVLAKEVFKQEDSVTAFILPAIEIAELDQR
ncbi:M16 family metallopeptidase [Erythrobacter crassostreae]|uniref:Insulinase family protein n=1 Tax=Erythrobacter crassostreae TaxID=2828328 RepID=A0A9X1JNR3_9SPHN|nr:M16 family metallopeptidase [Erythrobacter crassostrea]MBV7258667.1 insulinase family protein [Erythrobacter crassostrea]